MPVTWLNPCDELFPIAGRCSLPSTLSSEDSSGALSGKRAEFRSCVSSDEIDVREVGPRVARTQILYDIHPAMTQRRRIAFHISLG